MRKTTSVAFSVALFSAGLTGGFFVPWAGRPASEVVAIDLVSGERSTQAGNSALSMTLPESPKEAAPEPAAEPLTRLTAQEVSKRALQYTASIRGEGVYGAGIVVDARGYVLTNHHVIQGLEKIRVSFVDTEDMPAKVVEVDKELDLALLKVETTRPVAAIPGEFLDMQVGDDVYAVGSPRKMNFTVSRGMVSYVGRRIDGRYYLQSDLATNDGNSGGPVVNDRGQVVAVMTFILRDSQGLAFAVPISYAYERFAKVIQTDALDLARFTEWRESKDGAATASR